MRKILALVWIEIKMIFIGFIKNLPTFIAIVALYVAIDTSKKSDLQFERNMESSRSLFNIQIRNSKALNDSIVNEIKSLQEINSIQKDIVNEQLRISIETLQNYRNSERANASIMSVKVEDAERYINDYWKPKLVTEIKNIGKNSVSNGIVSAFTLNPNFIIINVTDGNLYYKASKNITPFHIPSQVTMQSTHIANINKEFKNDFFYCVIFDYDDLVLKEKFKAYLCYRYVSIAGKFNFILCNQSQIENIERSLVKATGFSRSVLFYN